MVEHAQQVEQIIKVIEDKVNVAKLEGNRPEAARLQNKVNELQDYLHGNNGAKISVDLSEFGFKFDAEEDNQPSEVENMQMLDDLKAAFQREDYETCFDLVTQFSKQDANIELVIQYGENALYIQGVSELILESEAYAAQNNWKEAIQVLEKMNSKNLYPENPFSISKEIREKAENLLFDYNKKFYEAKFEDKEKSEEESQSDVSSQNLSDADDQVQVQESVEDISLPVSNDNGFENDVIAIETSSYEIDEEFEESSFDDRLEEDATEIDKQDNDIFISDNLLDDQVVEYTKESNNSINYSAVDYVDIEHSPNSKPISNEVEEKRDNSGNMSQEEIAQKVDIYMAEALKAEANEKYAKAYLMLKYVLRFDTEHAGALLLLQKTQEKINDGNTSKEKMAIANRILSTEDVEDLKELSYEFETLKNQNSEDQEYQDLYDKANQNYLEKMRKQRYLSTADAVKNYYIVSDAIAEIDQSIQRGERNWIDDRSGASRPISQVRDEFMDNIKILAEEACKKLMDRSKFFLSRHDPFTAVKSLQEALKLEFDREELKNSLQNQLSLAKQELLQWETADKMLRDAKQIVDPFMKLENIKLAKSEYRYHFAIESQMEYANDSVALILESRINKAIIEANTYLVREEFDLATDCLKNALEKKDVLETTPKDLQGVIAKANSVLEEINSKEARRKNISENAKKMAEQIDEKNFDLAKKIYLGLPSDWRSDAAIAELRVFIDHLISNEERIASAQTHFENGNWSACIEECKKIGEEGALQEKIRLWRVTSQINIYKQQISQYWSKELYLDAEQVLQTLFSMPELSGKQEDDLRDEYAVYLQTIEELKLNDPAIAGKLADAEKAKGNNQLLLAYDTYSQLMEVNSTRKGFIRQQKESIEKTLHDDLIKKLEGSLKKEDFGKAYEYAETINQRHLFWGEDERILRANAVLSYVQQVTSELAKDNNWQAVIDEWEKAAREFPNELSIITELRIARRNKLIFDCERNLDKFNYAVVLSDIDESRIDLRDDPELEKFHRLAQILQEAEDMIARKEFTGLQNFLSVQQNTNEHPVIQKYKEQKTKEIVVSLVESGDELMNKGEIADALNNYAIAINMEPNDVTAQGRVQKQLPAVRAQVINLLDSAEQFSPGSVSVQEKLGEGIKIFESLRNFRSVVTYFDDENVDFDRKIKNKITEMEAQLGKLEQAKKTIDRYSETSKHWKALLHSGNWIQLDKDVRTLAQILSTYHPQYLEINNRKRIAIEQRKALGEILTSAKHAYDEENFDLAITAITEALQINSQIQRKDNPDPFGLIAEKATVYDFYKKQEVSGLEPLMELIEDKKIDHDKWKRWSEKVNGMSDLLSNSWEEIENTWPKGNVYGFDISNPTKKGIDALALCEKRHEEITHVYENEIPASGPISAKARLLKKQAIDLKSDIEKSQEQLSMLKRAYEESSSFVDFDELSIRAQDLIQQAAYIEAMEVIKTGLSYDPENQLFHYLNDICLNQLDQGHDLFKRIFRKR
jgi:hypothetical protein